jgi:hypothetical protein
VTEVPSRPRSNRPARRHRGHRAERWARVVGAPHQAHRTDVVSDPRAGSSGHPYDRRACRPGDPGGPRVGHPPDDRHDEVHVDHHANDSSRRAWIHPRAKLAEVPLPSGTSHHRPSAERPAPGSGLALRRDDGACPLGGGIAGIWQNQAWTPRCRDDRTSGCSPHRSVLPRTCAVHHAHSSRGPAVDQGCRCARWEQRLFRDVHRPDPGGNPPSVG